MKATRRILRYLKGSINYGILFPWDSESKEVMITWYLDVDWCGDKEDRRSPTDYLFQVLGALISLCSRKQHMVTLSSCEVEYIAGSYAAC